MLASWMDVNQVDKFSMFHRKLGWVQILPASLIDGDNAAVVSEWFQHPTQEVQADYLVSSMKGTQLAQP